MSTNTPSQMIANATHQGAPAADASGTRFTSWLARWRYALIAIVALLQAAALLQMIVSRENLIASGRQIDLKVVPVDPRDLFRGDYVTLSYGISRLPQALVSEQLARGDRVYVRLVRKDGNWEPAAAARQRGKPDTPEEITIAGRVTYAPRQVTSTGGTITVDYGIEKFFVPEGTGRELEKEVNARDVTAHIAIASDGTAAIRGITAAGHRYDVEPLF